MEKHFELFGLLVRDCVTGFVGVVTTISFDLYGCVQAIVTPEVLSDKPGEFAASQWFDVKRLRALGEETVMPLPTFDVVPGGASKPQLPAKPMR
jgi:hypothetical protein